MTSPPPLFGSPLRDSVEVLCNPLREITRLGNAFWKLPLVDQMLDQRLCSSYQNASPTFSSGSDSTIPSNFQYLVTQSSLEAPSGQPEEDFKISKKNETELLEKLPKLFHNDHVDFLVGSQVLCKIDQIWFYHGFICPNYKTY